MKGPPGRAGVSAQAIRNGQEAGETATLASWLSDRVRVEVDEKSDDLAAEVAQLRAQIAELTQTLGVPSGVEVAPDLPLDPGGPKLSQAEIGPR